jgi:uncharacterized membrane protein YcaP (DUF421 family)
MATVLIRTTLIYFLLVSMIRITGKRQIGDLQISELVITFMISELATIPIQDLSVPLSYSFLPIVLLLCYEVVISFLILKFNAFKKIFEGNPSILICKGKLNQKELKNARIGISELLGQLRAKNISDISQVDYAILEQDGQLSVFLKKEFQPITPDDLKIDVKNDGVCHAVIIDGKINESNLILSQKNNKWLKKVLESKNCKLDEVFLLTVNDKNDIYIIMKEKG